MFRKGDEPVHGYRLEQFLGRGAFGEVWRSSAPGGTRVGIKLINLSGKQGFKEYRAIERVKEIRHAHLLPIHAFWMLDQHGDVIADGQVKVPDDSVAGGVKGTMFVEQQRPTTLVVAMMLGDKSLYDRLIECQEQFGAESGIPVEELLEQMEDAAKGIDFLNSQRHDLGDGAVSLQHCDVKPQNILLVGNSALVCDFGLARVLGDTQRTATGMPGSPAYMAPECIRVRKPSRATDQYALAVSYCELRTGRLPFADDSYGAVLEAHLTGRLDLGNLAEGEREVIARATKVEPSERFTTSLEMVRALRRAVERGSGLSDSRRFKAAPMPVAPLPVASPPPPPAPPPVMAPPVVVSPPVVHTPTSSPRAAQVIDPQPAASAEVRHTIVEDYSTRQTPSEPDGAPGLSETVLLDSPATVASPAEQTKSSPAPPPAVASPSAPPALPVTAKSPRASGPAARSGGVRTSGGPRPSVAVRLLKTGGWIAALVAGIVVAWKVFLADDSSNGTTPASVVGQTPALDKADKEERSGVTQTSVTPAPRTKPVALQVEPADAQVMVNGRTRTADASGRLSVDVDPIATVRVEARRDGYEPFDQTLTVDQLESRNGRITLQRTAEHLVRHGLEKLRDKKYDEAIEDFNAAIKRGATSAELYNGRGEAYLQKNDLTRALDDFNQAISLAADFAPAYVNRGQVHRRQKDLDKAIADFEAAAGMNTSKIRSPAIDPLVETYVARGRERLSARDDAAGAVADFDAAIRYDSRFVDAYVGRAQAAQKQQNHDKAIEDFRTAHKLAADNSAAKSGLIAACTARAQLRNRQGKFDDAIVDASEAIALKPDVETYTARAFAYNEKQQYDQAIADLDAILRIDPANAVAYNNRGYSHNGKKDYEKAIADLTKAISLAATNPIAYGNRGFAYRQQSKFDLAIADYEKAQEQNTPSPDAINQGLAIALAGRAEASLGKGGAESAVNDLQRALKAWPGGKEHFTPKLAAAFVSRARAHGRQRRFDEAITDATAALAQDANHLDAYVVRGVAQVNANRFDDAVADFTELVRREPKLPRGYKFRGYAYLSKGDANLAVFDLNTAIGLDEKDPELFDLRAEAHKRRNQSGDAARAQADLTKARTLREAASPTAKTTP